MTAHMQHGIKTKENTMTKYSNDMFLVNVDALKILINDVISERIDSLTEAKSFDIEDHRNDIEMMISEYINYNVTVTIEG